MNEIEKDERCARPTESPMSRHASCRIVDGISGSDKATTSVSGADTAMKVCLPDCHRSKDALQLTSSTNDMGMPLRLRLGADEVQKFAIPAAIYRSAFRARAFPRSAFWAILGTCLGVPQRVLFECFLAFFGPKKRQKSTQKALFGALRGRCPKLPKKHSGGHFQARALKALL